MKPDNKIEPIVLLLCSLVIFYTICLVVVAKLMSSDGQTFQIIAGLVTGFSGALLMRVKPRGTTPDESIDSVPSSVRKVENVHTETTIPPNSPPT
jgi:hypothetical protein